MQTHPNAHYSLASEAKKFCESSNLHGAFIGMISHLFSLNGLFVAYPPMLLGCEYSLW